MLEVAGEFVKNRGMMRIYDMTISDRIMKWLSPAFTRLSERWPERFGVPSEDMPHASAMRDRWNIQHRVLFSGILDRVQMDAESLADLRRLSSEGTVIYVFKNLGHLEYAYFNSLFLENSIPLAAYNNSVTLKRWMRWGDFFRTIRSEEAKIAVSGEIPDPLDDGLLPEMIASGKSAFIRVPASDLLDDGLLMTGESRALIEVVKAGRLSAEKVFILPVEFLWSRRPDKLKKSLFEILFGEKEFPGIFRSLILFLRRFRSHAQVAMGKPIDLGEFIIASGGSDQDVALRLKGMLLGSLRASRQTVTGPLVKPRSWFLNEVMSDPELDESICNIAADLGKEAESVRDLAEKYIREIASDIDYTYVEVMDRILGSTLNRIYESYEIDTKGLKRTKDLYSEGPVILVPNHKSHVDYLILSHVLHKNGMTVPQIAAGINMSFWPMGKIFRRCGAYFIRREFKDNTLYKAVLETYLKILLKEGYCQEFFIEGGRSRTGKLRMPKLGMIAMLERAAKRAGFSKLSFMPVSLTYDRVMEEGSYVAESEGADKQPENAGQLIKLTKYLKGRAYKHGSIYVRFGEPVEMSVDQPSPQQVQEIGESISRILNDNCVITPVALAAASLLSHGRRGVTLEEFNGTSKLIYDYLRKTNNPFSSRFDSQLEPVMMKALSMLSSRRLVSINMSALGDYISVGENKRNELAFFKNSIAHFLLPLSVACMEISNSGTPIRRKKMLDDLPLIRDLLAHEFRFERERLGENHLNDAIDFLIESDIAELSAEGNIYPSPGFADRIENLSRIVIPYLETLYIAAVHAHGICDRESDEKELIENMARTGTDLLMLDRIRHKEAINRFDLAHTIPTLLENNLLTELPLEIGKKRRRRYGVSCNNEMAQNIKVELEKLL